MKITASKRDDILKQKEEYDADRARRKKLHDDDMSKYHGAVWDEFEAVKSKIVEELKQFNLDIRVDVNYARIGRKGVRVYIADEDNKFSPDKSLSWSYRCEIDEQTGEVEKESSSWSGLQAVTETQLNHLKEVVKCLEHINQMDWKTLLDVELPKYRDYVTHPDPAYTDKDVPDYNRMLKEAEIEEVIGQDILVSGTSLNGRGKAYYLILKETPKQYEVCQIYAYYLDDAIAGNSDRTVADIVEANRKYTERVTKDKLFGLLSNPLETLEVK